MVNRPRRQGTSWETELVTRARAQGLLADRLPEAGISDTGDVWLINPRGNRTNTKIALAWKRLTGQGGHRTPDGVRDGVFITTQDFLELVTAHSILHPDIGWVVECKATQALNVTRTLDRARRKALPG